MDRCENRRLPLAGVCSFMHDLAQAIHYLHSHVTLHRDLKPCDFFFFAAVKRNSSGQRFDSLDGLFDAGESFLGRLCADVFQKIFQE
jgi:hypothetical protein